MDSIEQVLAEALNALEVLKIQQQITEERQDEARRAAEFTSKAVKLNTTFTNFPSPHGLPIQTDNHNYCDSSLLLLQQQGDAEIYQEKKSPELALCQQCADSLCSSFDTFSATAMKALDGAINDKLKNITTHYTQCLSDIRKLQQQINQKRRFVFKKSGLIESDEQIAYNSSGLIEANKEQDKKLNIKNAPITCPTVEILQFPEVAIAENRIRHTWNELTSVIGSRHHALRLKSQVVAIQRQRSKQISDILVASSAASDSLIAAISINLCK